MIYDPKSPYDVQKATVRFNRLIRGTDPFSITVEKEKKNLTDEQLRTIRQNNLVHLWFAVFADEIGTTADECKRDVKRTLLGQKQVFNTITGKIDFDDYHISEMTIGELSSFMDKFKVWAQMDFGCYLPYWGDPGYDEMVSMYKNR